MRELVFVEPGRIEWRERPGPQLDSARAALVRPLAVSRCDLDEPLATGRMPVGHGYCIGHEFVAEVLEVGSSGQRHQPGALVCVPFQISCGECARCLRGHTGSCSAVPFTSAYGLAAFSGREWGGAIADVVLVPFADAMLVPLPAGLAPWRAAGASDNICDGYRCVRQPLAENPGANVLVIGGGAASIGLYAVAAARALGASEVVYVDAARERLAIAEGLGARVIEGAAPDAVAPGRRFPIVVDASANPAGLQLCLRSTDVEGTCTSVGMYPSDVPLPLWELYLRGVRFLTGRTHARALMPEVLARIADGSLRVDAIAPTRVSWEDAPTAWVQPALKLIVERAS